MQLRRDQSQRPINKNYEKRNLFLKEDGYDDCNDVDNCGEKSTVWSRLFACLEISAALSRTFDF